MADNRRATQQNGMYRQSNAVVFMNPTTSQGVSGIVIIEKVFGEVLKDLRQERGLSQEQLGFESGYHRTYISLLERGKKNPSLSAIFRLANALKTNPSDILRRIESRVYEILERNEKGHDR